MNVRSADKKPNKYTNKKKQTTELKESSGYQSLRRGNKEELLWGKRRSALGAELGWYKRLATAERQTRITEEGKKTGIAENRNVGIRGEKRKNSNVGRDTKRVRILKFSKDRPKLVPRPRWGGEG